MRKLNLFTRVLVAASLAGAMPASAVAQAARAGSAVPKLSSGAAGSSSAVASTLFYIGAVLAGMGVIYDATKKKPHKPRPVSRG